MTLFNQDAEKSLRGVEKFVKPVLQKAFGTSKIYPTERRDNELAALLDQCASIDGIIVVADGWTFSYASRVQFGKNYESFSIRRSRPSGATTEYDKLKNPLQLKPTFHVQTFVDKDEQSAIVGIAETTDLLKYIEKHKDQWRTAPTGETFYYIPFDEVAAAQVYRVVGGQVFEKKKSA